MISLDLQVKRMRAVWPQFEPTTGLMANSVVWFGSLVGMQRPYRVSIEYGHVQNTQEAALRPQFPVVRVLSPALRPNFYAAEEGPLPHVYFTAPRIELCPLCLFDPEANEWTEDDFIADTTVPWAADWLACYEGWRATGKWRGGGRHASEPLKEAA